MILPRGAMVIMGLGGFREEEVTGGCGGG